MVQGGDPTGFFFFKFIFIYLKIYIKKELEEVELQFMGDILKMK
jgi:hypothetical protein